jgi:hypothetical protein
MKVNFHYGETVAMPNAMPSGAEIKPERPRTKISWDGSVNVGTMLHLSVLVVTIVLAWASFDKRTSILDVQLQQMAESQKIQLKAITDASIRTERIERYLISKDPKYLEQFSFPPYSQDSK